MGVNGLVVTEKLLCPCRGVLGMLVGLLSHSLFLEQLAQLALDFF